MRKLTNSESIVVARLSAVLQLLDDVTGQPALAAQPQFWLDLKPVTPQAKANAFYVFENLPDGLYRLDIRFPKHRYFDQSLQLQVPGAENLAQAIVLCHLQPTPLYPFSAGATILYGQIREAEHGSYLTGVAITGAYQSASGKAKTVLTQSCDFTRYQGRFAFALAGNLAAQTALKVVFEKHGFSAVNIEMKLTKSTTSSANIEMRKTQGK